MTLKKNTLIFFCLLIINLAEIFYQVSFKLGLDYGGVYIFFFGLALLIILMGIPRLNDNNVLVLSLLIFYCTFQLFNGFYGGSEIKDGVIVFISLFIIYFVSVFCACLTLDELKWHLVWFNKRTIFILVFMDMLSIFFMGKSQHVILSNILPILLISSIVLSYDREKGLILYLLAYASWILVSVYFFTSDHRLQLKAVAVSLLLCFAYFLFFSIRNIFKLSFFRKSGAKTYIFMTTTVLLCNYLIYDYLSSNPYSARETSLTLRYLVADSQINDYISGNWFNMVFGYGFGSSITTYQVHIIEYIHSLKSHSGFFSLIYEHGVFFLISFVLFIYFIFHDQKKTYNISKINLDKGFFQFSIFLLVSILISLNTFYLISVPVPNYAHQSQIILVTATFVYLRKKIYEA